ncbi:metallophosphoesterase [Bradyrhizobium sp. LHD-71]|uniref:metallophosphoesterase family protein n=1 Tax=Bradyrhizobium sp. LHD-71 TaxID=3072141 RepID=UPI00280CC52D|nr:metallophosphoesterase [Bradyrhizobium sp. LHD-71]MDQ8727384.1 metallophosphoesterase [Bradyrhizobium sp. LHD-71]
MRTVRWLQISDFHLRTRQAWEQDVVLSAMCKSIERKCKGEGGLDFILATGDLAFSGKAEEYQLSSAFFDEIVKVTGVPRERIFFIPGNHDVNRDRQKMCFAGARHVLQNENAIDDFLGSPEEVATLLQRQEHYNKFQETYSAGQERHWTADRLGYMSPLAVDDLRIAIIGVNTAWLSEGGITDHGKLLAGERQVIDLLRIAQKGNPHLIVAMGHHPFHLLNDFDRRPVQRRIEEVCQFYHCGHLHDPESHSAGRSAMHCLTVAAGASFDSRHTHNAYSMVSLDVMAAERRVTTVQYRPTDGAFSYESKDTFPFEVTTSSVCGLEHLGTAILAYRASLSPVAYYLAALLVEAQAELPIPAGKAHAFGSFDVLRSQPDSELKTAAVAFMALRNPLRLFCASMSLDDFLGRYGVAIERYGSILLTAAQSDGGLLDKLDEREADARAGGSGAAYALLTHIGSSAKLGGGTGLGPPS